MSFSKIHVFDYGGHKQRPTDLITEFISQWTQDYTSQVDVGQSFSDSTCFFLHGIVDDGYKKVVITGTGFTCPCQLFLEGETRVWRFSDQPFPLTKTKYMSWKLASIVDRDGNEIVNAGPVKCMIEEQVDEKYASDAYWKIHQFLTLHDTNNKLFCILKLGQCGQCDIWASGELNSHFFNAHADRVEHLLAKEDILRRRCHPINP